MNIFITGVTGFLGGELLVSLSKRDEVKKMLADCFVKESSSHWIDQLHESGLWAIEVFDWEQMMNHEAYLALQMEQALNISDKTIITTRCPIRINKQYFLSAIPAPKLGEHTEKLKNELVKEKI